MIRDPWDLLIVSRWSVKWRRAFLILLPISGPLWVACLFALMVVTLLILFIGTPIVAAVELWRDDSHGRG